MQKMKQGTLQILDIREIDEYEEGHIFNSIHLPMSRIQDQYKQLDRQQTYYVICHSGSRSDVVCRYLAPMGYKVVNIMGGIATYRGKLET